MAELKTKQTDRSVEEFINGISDEKTRNDCYTVLKLMQKVTGEKPKMWGSSIVGFGNYHYKYESGREGDWFLVGFSPRKQNLTLYLMYGLERLENLLKKLGKYKTGKSCLYIKSLADIDQSILKELIKQSVDSIRKRY